MAGEDSDTNNGFLVYHEPNIVQILVLISFFFFLSFGEWLSNKVFRAGLIGQIIVGMIYGLPLGNVLDVGWQQAFVALGYLGLILIIFEGEQLQPLHISPLMIHRRRNGCPVGPAQEEFHSQLVRRFYRCHSPDRIVLRIMLCRLRLRCANQKHLQGSTNPSSQAPSRHSSSVQRSPQHPSARPSS